MFVNNRSIELFREHSDAKKLFFPVKKTPACVEEEEKMKECLLNNHISVLDHKSKLANNSEAEMNCNVVEWKANCPGVWRRQLVEETYRAQMNRQSYDQESLNKYLDEKVAKHNFNVIHWSR